MNLGLRIREVRLRKQLTQRDVAGDYMTRNMLSRIENGSAVPSVKTLEHLAQVLEVPMSYFVGGEEGGQASVGESRHQLAEIGKLACLLETQEPSQVGMIARCIRARGLLGEGKAEDACGLMEAMDFAHASPRLLLHICKIGEECCKEVGDYKRAYDYASRRMNLMAADEAVFPDGDVHLTEESPNNSQHENNA